MAETPAFADLIFKPWHNGTATRATMQFANGYSVSVVNGPQFYTNGPEEYELAVLHGKDGLVYDTPVTDDVLGYLTADAVTDALLQVAALPEREK